MELTKEDAIKQLKILDDNINRMELTKEDAIKQLKILDDTIKIIESKRNEEINKLELKLIRLNDEEEKLILEYDSSWK